MAGKKDLVAYCGLYCGGCPSYTHTMANLAKDLLREFRSNSLDEVAPHIAKMPEFKAFKHYDKSCDLLETVIKLRCKDACRLGGGSSQCPIRKCVKKRKLDGCWKCDDFTTCKTLKILEEYGDVDKYYRKNIKKIKRIGLAEFVKTINKPRRRKKTNSKKK